MSKRRRCNIFPVVLATILQDNRIMSLLVGLLSIFKNNLYKHIIPKVFLWGCIMLG